MATGNTGKFKLLDTEVISRQVRHAALKREAEDLDTRARWHEDQEAEHAATAQRLYDEAEEKRREAQEALEPPVRVELTVPKRDFESARGATERNLFKGTGFYGQLASEVKIDGEVVTRRGEPVESERYRVESYDLSSNGWGPSVVYSLQRTFDTRQDAEAAIRRHGVLAPSDYRVVPA